MPDETAPCGLRTRHGEHPYGDRDELWCDGLPPPDHYDAKHRGRYRPEPDWWTSLASAFRCKHRGSGDPTIADERPRAPRPRPRLLWLDRGVSREHEDDAG
jgi:hypothetical protein